MPATAATASVTASVTASATTPVHGHPGAPAALLAYATSCALPTPWAEFTLHAWVEEASGKEHLAMVLGDLGNGEPVLARVHSECLTGDVMFSQRCDCGAQLEGALRRIAEEGRGIVLYLRQEGRGIGLINKIRAYRLQEAGADTVEANLQLGFHADARNYELCRPMLAQFGIRAVRLMTNNPRKIDALTRLGIAVTERVPLLVNRNAHNNSYLDTKQAKLGHMMVPLAPVVASALAPAAASALAPAMPAALTPISALEQDEPVAPAAPAPVA